ncbi:MAG: phage portal protein, partial [Eubacterium sp.]
MKRKSKKEVQKNRSGTKKNPRNESILKAFGDAPVMESRVMVTDSFQSFYGSDDYGNTILEPPYNPNVLAKMTEESDILGCCVNAYETNIVGFGYSVQSDVESSEEKDVQKVALEREMQDYKALFKYCNFDSGFTKIMKQVINDRETIGWGCFEVIPNVLGEPSGFTHIPAHQIRMCAKQNKPVDVEWHVKSDSGEILTYTLKKRFRKFVQVINGKLLYFKEFGDPRSMDCYTGEYKDDVEGDREATSIIFFNIYCSYSPYGLPRYMGQLLNMCGSREANELNYNYFKSGRHVPMAVIVNGGHLTNASQTLLKDSTGKEAQHKYLLLEAEANEPTVSMVGMEENNRVSVDIKPLATVMQSDGLFQDYCQKNRDIIRAAFRLPPLYTGESQDYNKATSDTARAITEEQVFQPERASLEEEINNLLKNALGIYDASLKFNEPVISDDAEKAAALKAYSEIAGVTPNMVVGQVSNIIGRELPEFEEEWGNVPLPIYMAMLNKNGGEEERGREAQEPVEKSDRTESILEGLHALQAYCEDQD